MFSKGATIDWLNRRRENVGNLARWPFYVLLAVRLQKIAIDCNGLGQTLAIKNREILVDLGNI